MPDWRQEYLNASADAAKFAAENAQLRAENKRLRRALRDIVYYGPRQSREWSIKIATEAVEDPSYIAADSDIGD